jgi:hypothetical protein
MLAVDREDRYPILAPDLGAFTQERMLSVQLIDEHEQWYSPVGHLSSLPVLVQDANAVVLGVPRECPPQQGDCAIWQISLERV